MGNKNNRRGKKPTLLTSPTSFNNSGAAVNPESFAQRDITPNNSPDVMISEEDEAKVFSTSSIGSILEQKHATTSLGFVSYATGTLDTTRFQPPGYIPKKVEPVFSEAQSLSVKSPEFIPKSQNKQSAGKSVGGGSSSARQFLSKPTNKQGKPPQPSAGLERLQNLIRDFPPYYSTHYLMHMNDYAKPSASAWPVGRSRATTSPTPLKAKDPFIRVDPTKRDLIIAADGISRNRYHVDELQLVDGKHSSQPNLPCKTTNVLSEIAEKGEAGKKKFWANHVVEIIVDLRGLLDDTRTDKEDGGGQSVTADMNGKINQVVSLPTLIGQINKLGNDFFMYATCVAVNIIFPPPCADALELAPARPYGPTGMPHDNSRGDFSIVVNTPGFQLLQMLVSKIDKCVSLECLEVIIQNPNASTTLPFTVEQLLYALPFYDLRYEYWTLKWQGNYMSAPTEVGRFPIVLLDKERNKWLWAQKMEQKMDGEAARNEKKRISNMGSAGKSIAQRPKLPEPLSPDPKSPTQQT
jgi:hypothetical protein